MEIWGLLILKFSINDCVYRINKKFYMLNWRIFKWIEENKCIKFEIYIF